MQFKVLRTINETRLLQKNIKHFLKHFFLAYVSLAFKKVPVGLIKDRTQTLKKHNIYSPVVVNFS